MTLATPPELSTLVQYDVEHDLAILAIELASASVTAEAGIDIAEATSTDELLDGDGAPELVLPEWPVSAVSSVTVIEADGTEDTLRGPDDSSPEFRWSAAGILYRVGAWWPCRPRSVKVTWTHGHDPVPDGLRSVTLSVAARLIGNPQQLQSFQADDSQTAFGETGRRVIELTDGEKMLVKAALR